MYYKFVSIKLYIKITEAKGPREAVRPEKFQFLEKGQNRKFDYKIVISVKNP